MRYERQIVSRCLALVCASMLAIQAEAPVAEILRWEDLPASTERRLVAAGLDARGFLAFGEEQAQLTQARVRESDLDALIYYALQSVAFTNAPPIEPAASAKAFVERLDADSRARFLAHGSIPTAAVPPEVRGRLAQLIPALRHPSPGLVRRSAQREGGSRLAHFRDVVSQATQADGGHHSSGAGEVRGANELEAWLLQQYVRAARFLYEKEFVAPARSDRIDAIAALYRQRALSTDTSVEAGYLVHLGLATLRLVDPERRIRRVLVVGPGLELASRTGLLEVAPPQSYQPYALLDSLVALDLSRLGDVSVLCADVNPRVVQHIQAAKATEVALTLISGIGASATTTLQDDYRHYFEGLGRSIGRASPAPRLPEHYRGHLNKSLQIRPDVSRAIDAIGLDIARQRLLVEPFDLIVATNVFLYMSDIPLTLALGSLSSMLAPGGVLIHNEARPLVAAVTTEQQLPIAHARTAQIASVRGAAAPLYDSVFVHVKRRL
jgi:hypothetical protein